MSRRVRLYVLLTAVAVASVACGETGAPPGDGIPETPPLETMAPSVQQQIRAQAETLDAVVKRPSATDRDRAREFGLMGELLMAAESTSAAKSFLLRASRLDPSDPRWSYYLAHLHRMLGDLEESALCFNRVLVHRPDDVAALVWLGHTYVAQGRPADAAPLYERALARQPGLFAALAGLGRAASLRGDYAAAVTYFEASLRSAPDASVVHYPLALAYRQLGRVGDAERHLRARGEHDPGPPDPLMQELAGLLRSPIVFERQGDRALARGDMASAISSFRRALELAPDRIAVQQKLATALALSGDTANAVALYEQLLSQNPRFAEAHYSLGALWLGARRMDLAATHFAAAVEADPTYLQARLQLAHALRRLGRFDDALAEYQGALNLEPRAADARLGYAVTLARLQRWGAARAWLIEGRRAHPDQLQFTEALVRLLSAAPDANVRDGRMALEIAAALVAQSPTWSTQEAFAMSLAEAGRFDEAVIRQREAMEAYRRTGSSDAGMHANLQRYERGQPARTPWSVDPI